MTLAKVKNREHCVVSKVQRTGNAKNEALQQSLVGLITVDAEASATLSLQPVQELDDYALAEKHPFLDLGSSSIQCSSCTTGSSTFATTSPNYWSSPWRWYISGSGSQIDSQIQRGKKSRFSCFCIGCSTGRHMHWLAVKWDMYWAGEFSKPYSLLTKAVLSECSWSY